MAIQLPQTSVIAVPAGGSIRVFAGDNTTVIAQAGATGTVTVDYSLDGANFFGAVTSATGGAVNVNGRTVGLGQFGVIRVAAATVAGNALVCDLSQPGYYAYANGGLLLSTGALYTTPNATTETTVLPLRIPAGMLKANFRIEFDVEFSLAGAGGTKTFKLYFGNTGSGTSIYAPTAVASGTADGRIRAIVQGANDGATVNCYGSIDAAAAVANTKTQITSNATYLITEQELYLTITKGTGTDTATVFAAAAKLYQ